MVKRLLNEGFYTNIGIFPGVPVKCCGLRLAITNGQTDDDIKNVLEAFHYHFPRVLEEENQTVEDISQNFNMSFDATASRYAGLDAPAGRKGSLTVQHETTIERIDKELWNSLLADRGTFDWEGCRFIEQTFKNNPQPENNWNMHYLIIRDHESKPVLATFFSELMCKDDMIAPADVSRQIEDIRLNDRYHLTSKVVMLGSLLSLGEHLFLDRTSSDWKKALLNMVRIMNDVKRSSGATMILLRDFNTDDIELRDFLATEGFIRSDMFNDHVIDDLNWSTTEELIPRLSPKSRVHLRRNILANEPLFSVKVNGSIAESTVDQKYALYMQVKNRGFEMNTFELPRKFFSNLGMFGGWEIIELTLNESNHEGPVAFGIGYRSPGNNYIPLLIGLNYRFNETYGVYRQLLFQTVKRAADLKCNKLFFGFGADVEKRKFGTRLVHKSVYIQADDNYKFESLNKFQQVNYAK
ncbi:MAG: GNAT family N-acetyltransferase [Bacteroidia bacterium]|nr:GNAT family N-acetyltransferase [Bacteroidia bacterium]